MFFRFKMSVQGLLLIALPVLLLVFSSNAQAQLQQSETSIVPPVFLEDIKSEEDFNNLTDTQKQELDEYFRVSQDEMSVGENNDGVTVVATVEVYDAEIAIIDGRKITATFDLFNDQGFQSDIVYGVRLMRVIDSAVASQAAFLSASEVLSLGENETVPTVFEFTVPEYLPGGDYYMILEVTNKSGMALAGSELGTVTFEASDMNKIIEIDSSQCSLSIAGEDLVLFDLTQGVDVDSSDKVHLLCNIVNLTTEDIVITPQFETYSRLVQTNIKVDVVYDASILPITIEAGETKKIDIQIPISQTPQAYDLDVFFLDNTGVRISNSVVAHYVVRGLSGTLQNILLDKKDYVIGETADVMVVYSLAADSFPDSRSEGGGTIVGDVTLEAELTDITGASCADMATQVFPQNGSGVVNLQIPVTQDCAQTVVTTRLVQSESGLLLSEVLPELQETEPSVVVQESSDIDRYVWGFAVLLLLVILITLMLRMRDKPAKDNVTALLFFLCVVGVGLGSGAERAEAASVQVNFGYHNGPIYVQMVYSINKTSYGLGENLSAYTSLRINACSNGQTNAGYTYVRPSTSNGYSYMSYGYRSSGYGSWGRTLNFTVQNGWAVNNKATFRLTAISNKGGTHYRYRNVSYTVAYPVPLVTTMLADNITPTEITFRGKANPNGYTTNGYFNYGTVSNTCENLSSTVGGNSLSNGTSDIGFSQPMTGLPTDATYYYCAVATNVYGTDYGTVFTATTLDGKPDVTTVTPHTALTSNGVTLHGKANPNGFSTTGRFNLGTTNAPDCDAIPAASGAVVLGAGSADFSYSIAMSNLSAATTYYYCATADNINGTGYADVQSFTTSNDLPTASIVVPAGDLTVLPNTSVGFQGSGSDPDGMVGAFAYEWRDGSCSAGAPFQTAQSFNTSAASGVHNIYLRVRDDEGGWSTNCPFRTITIPSADITFTGYNIGLGVGTADINIDVDGEDTTAPYSLKKGGAPFASPATEDSSTPDTGLTIGDYTYTFSDNAGLLDTKTAAVRCDPADLSAFNINTSTCEVAPMAPTISITIDPDSKIVRSGESPTVIVNTDSTDGLTCDLYGATAAPPHTFVVGSGNLSTVIASVKPFTSAQEIKAVCRVTFFPSITASATNYVEVVGLLEEV